MSVTSKHYLAVKLKFRCLKGELELASDILPFRYSPTNETVYKIFLFHFLLGNAIVFTGKKYPPRCVDEIKRKENKVIDHSDR